MAHGAQQDFFKRVKDKFPERFKNCDVLDIGSLDINGNNHFLFEDYTYTGVDIGPGNNVDVVSKGHQFHPGKQYDIVISSECFEHDYFYRETIMNCVKLTKPGGLFTFTCASTGRAEHGTIKSGSGWASPFSHVEWFDYYKNLTKEDILEFLDVELYFSEYFFDYNPEAFDLYFWGIKK